MLVGLGAPYELKNTQINRSQMNVEILKRTLGEKQKQ